MGLALLLRFTGNLGFLSTPPYSIGRLALAERRVDRGMCAFVHEIDGRVLTHRFRLVFSRDWQTLDSGSI